MAVMERIALAREYKVAEWLRHVYTELTQKRPFNFEELQPAEPYFESNSLDTSDWEAEAKKWKAISRDWETLAKISQLQTKVANSIASPNSSNYCNVCCMYYGMSCRCLCKCRLATMADEAFQEELENLKEDPKPVKKRPVQRKLPILYLYPFKLKSIIYIRQGHH